MQSSFFLMFILLLLSLASCLPDTQTGQIRYDGQRIVYGLTLQPSGFDPHIHRSSELGIPLRQVYDTLIYRDPDTRAFVPGLAESWSVSEDGLTYTFNLRRDVTFHDDTPFNAQAVAANLNRIVDPATASQRAVFMLGPFYEGYEIVDDYTISLLLSEPYSPLLDSLAQVYLGIASPTALSTYSNNRYQFHQVGTGPFRLVDFIPGERIVIRRNAAYNWGPAFYDTPGENAINEIEFQFFTDPPTRILALESGAAQVMGELLPTDARTLTGNSSIQLVPVNIPGQPLQFMMNTERFPTDMRSVRQALLFGTNRNAIIDSVYQRFSPVAWGPLTTSTLYYNREMDGLYAFDISQAESLLENSGLQDTNNDGYRDIGGVEVTIDVVVPPWGLTPQVAELLQDQMRTIGVRVNLLPVPTFSTMLDIVSTGEYNLVAFNTAGMDPALLDEFYMSDGSSNWSGFASDELDNLLREAIRRTDNDARLRLYAEVQRLIMGEALILPIRDYVNLNAATSGLSLEFDAYGWFPILNNLAYTAAS